MRADALVGAQLLMAQSIHALADHIEHSTGFLFTPVPFAQLPAEPKTGMIACITDSNTKNFGSVIGPAAVGRELPPPYTVLAWYNGTSWTVIGQ